MAEGLEPCPSGTNKPVFLADALGGDLHHLLATHVGQGGQFRHAGDEFVDAQLGGLVGSAIGRAGTGTGDGAAGGENDYVGQFLLLLGFLGAKAGRQDQQQGEGAWGEGFHCSVHVFIFSLPNETVGCVAPLSRQVSYQRGMQLPSWRRQPVPWGACDVSCETEKGCRAAFMFGIPNESRKRCSVFRKFSG